MFSENDSDACQFFEDDIIKKNIFAYEPNSIKRSSNKYCQVISTNKFCAYKVKIPNLPKSLDKQVKIVQDYLQHMVYDNLEGNHYIYWECSDYINIDERTLQKQIDTNQTINYKVMHSSKTLFNEMASLLDTYVTIHTDNTLSSMTRCCMLRDPHDLEYLNTNFSIINPSIINFANKTYYIMRFETVKGDFDASFCGFYFAETEIGDFTSPLTLHMLTNVHSPKHCYKLLKRDQIKPGLHLNEDARFFSYNNNIYASCASLLEKSEKSFKMIPSIIKLDTQNMEMQTVGFPKLDFKINPVEKNWIFFTHESHLYLIYSIQPYILLRLKDHDLEKLEFETVINKNINYPIDIKANNIWNQYTDFCDTSHIKYSLSTNVVDFNKNYYLVLMHNNVWWTYLHYGVLINKKTLDLDFITRIPIIHGNNHDLPKITYLSTILKEDNKFHMLYNVNDLSTCHAIVTYQELRESMVRIIH